MEIAFQLLGVEEHHVLANAAVLNRNDSNAKCLAEAGAAFCCLDAALQTASNGIALVYSATSREEQRGRLGQPSRLVTKYTLFCTLTLF